MIALFMAFFAWGFWQIGLMPLWVPITTTVLSAVGIVAKCYEEVS